MSAVKRKWPLSGIIDHWRKRAITKQRYSGSVKRGITVFSFRNG